jgi:hypothetical protein
MQNERRESSINCTERVAAMNRLMTAEKLKTENQRYRSSPAVSENNRCAGFAPAFQDRETGRTELSRFASGSLAPCHLIDGLPKDWVVARDAAGHTLAIKSSVVAGFVRGGCFYTREEAARAYARDPAVSPTNSRPH